MNLLSEPIIDNKIDARNVIVEMTLREYYDLVKDVMKKNDFQRSRVRSSKNIYALLKQDLMMGCLIPPIVLSMEKEYPGKDAINNNFLEKNKDSLLILDGLQRTYTIQDIVNEVLQDKSKESTLQNIVRVEIYFGLNKEGILYRMLTLNTGQTPMKLRHQVEIIYSGLLEAPQENFSLIKDTEGNQTVNANTFRFNDAVDLFTSYIEGDYLQITRDSLLNGIKAFDNLMKLSKEKNIFSDLIKTYSVFIEFVQKSVPAEGIDKTELSFPDNPFGTNGISIFNKSQAMTGFGAAVSKLITLNTYMDIISVGEVINAINKDNMKESLFPMLENLNELKNISKKIGNSQRCYFYYYFKALFDSNQESYLKPTVAVDKAMQDLRRDL